MYVSNFSLQTAFFRSKHIVESCSSYFSSPLSPPSLTSHSLAEECDLKSVKSMLKKIAALPQVDTCGSASGFSLSPPSGVPSASQLNKICAEASCIESVRAMAAFDLPSCTLTLLNNINIHEIVAQIQSRCETQSAGADSTNQTGSPILRVVAPSDASNSAVDKNISGKSCE